jgi:hypothetical protein
MFFRNCFNHPTVMIRKSALLNSGINYGVIPEGTEIFLPEELSGVGDEDYLLFGLISLFGKVGNLNEVLLDYRVHRNSLTALFTKKQSEQTKRISDALQTICIQSDAKLNPSKDLISISKNETNKISAVERIILNDYSEPNIRNRINMMSQMQSVILFQSSHSIFRRLLIALSFFYKFNSFRRADINLLLRYIAGPGCTNHCKHLFGSFSR